MATKESSSHVNEYDSKEQKRGHTSALGVGLICLLVGLPLWWKTTEVYRVSLPYSDIQHLSETTIKYLSEVEVIWATGEETSQNFLSNLATALMNELDNERNGGKLLARYQVSVREASLQEQAAIKKISSVSHLKDILPSENLMKYHVIVVKNSPLFKSSLFAPNNNIFLNEGMSDKGSLSSQIVNLVRDMTRQSTVRKSLESAQGIRLNRPDKNTMRSFRYHTSYDLSFTLMVPEPDVVNVQWDIEAGVQDYLEPLVTSLQEYTKLTVSSQVIYFTSIGGRLKKGQDHFYLGEQELPHTITPLESKLGSHASSNPTLNFIVYIPTRESCPLVIYNKEGQPVPSNSFLSPRWGGVLIYNVNSTSSQPEVMLDMHKVMEVFISQIRLLLNVQRQGTSSEVQILSTGSASLTLWELAGWLRSRCVENIAMATNTVSSLAQLLEEIGNIVINDDIGKEVESAVDAIKRSKQLLQTGLLQEAFLASKEAVEASEKAFFHPSLLELLYFPEDQKFAIYIPLFLPVSIPILTSVLSAIKYFKQLKKTKQE